MEKDTGWFTDEQQRAYLLRQKKLSYRKIAEEMGISEYAAKKAVRLAERRLREEAYLQRMEYENQLMDFPVTRGELEEIRFSLEELEQNLAYRIGKEYTIRVYIRYERLCNLLKRAEIALYGRSFRDMEPSDRI